MGYAMAKDTRAALMVGTQLKCDNRSLFADKFPEFPDSLKDKEARSRTVERLTGNFEIDLKGVAARRKALTQMQGTVAVEAALGGRLIVNQAGGVIENAGLAFDRQFGVPFIPGSALKGITREGARLAGATPEEMLLVFGWAMDGHGDSLPQAARDTSFAGTVAFLPAYPLAECRIERDLVNCHHHKYYSQKTGREPALDVEAPIPNAFPVVPAGTVFGFLLMPADARRAAVMRAALGLPAEFDPLAKAREWLILGITDHGVGAKTAAGYGWFIYDAVAEQRRDEERRQRLAVAAAEAQARQAEQARLGALSPVDRCMEEIAKLSNEPFAHFAKALSTKTPDEQRAFVRLLRTNSAKKEWWKTKKKKDEALRDSILKVAMALGEELQ